MKFVRMTIILLCLVFLAVGPLVHWRSGPNTRCNANGGRPSRHGHALPDPKHHSTDSGAGVQAAPRQAVAILYT